MNTVLKMLHRHPRPFGVALWLGLFLCGAISPAFDNCWISLTGPVDYGLAPAYGVRGVASATSQPGIREKTVTWSTPGGEYYMFGGTSLDAATLNEVTHNDLWRLDPASHTWIWVAGDNLPNQAGVYAFTEGSDQAPGARDFAAGWIGADGMLYLFGGYGFDTAGSQGLLNDLWRYDPAGGQWTWIKGSDTINPPGVYGDPGVAGAANTPGGRRGSQAWTGADGKFYLFGGYGTVAAGGVTGYLNDLWVYDPDTGLWAWLKGSAVANEAGSYGEAGVADAGNTPGGRVFSAGWTGADGNLYLFGGARYVSVTDTGEFNDLWRYDPVANMWTWLKGRSILNDPGVYGQKGVAEAANVPPSRSYAVAWRDPLGPFYLFGGLFYDADTKKFSHKNDLWRYDPLANQWTWLHGGDGLNAAGAYGEQGVAGSANTPGARSYAAVWTDGQGQVLLYGGHGYKIWAYSELLNDLWSYDTAGNEWTWAGGVNPQAQNGVFTPVGTSDPAARPSSRGSNGVWTTAAGEFYLFGGTGLDAQGQRGLLNDVWRYRLADGQWTRLAGGAVHDAAGVYGDLGLASPQATPGGRDGMAVWRGDFDGGYLFGGQGMDEAGIAGRLNDLWRFDLASGQWTWLMGESTVNTLGHYGAQGVTGAANIPGARSYAARWVGPDGSFYLFGGSGYGVSDGPGMLDDLWRFDPASSQWTWLGGSRLINQPSVYGALGVADDGNTPGGRYSVQTWTGPDGRLYLYGGVGIDSRGNSGALGDMWRYDPAAGQWTWIKGSDRRNEFAVYGRERVAGAVNTPGCRLQSAVWTGTDGLFYLFGGFSRAEGDLYNIQFNDMWRYDPATNRWSWLNGSGVSLQPGIYGDQGVCHPLNSPGARTSSMAWTASGGRLYLFGGSGYDAGGNLNEINDLWMFEPGRLAVGDWLDYR